MLLSVLFFFSLFFKYKTQCGRLKCVWLECGADGQGWPQPLYSGSRFPGGFSPCPQASELRRRGKGLYIPEHAFHASVQGQRQIIQSFFSLVFIGWLFQEIKGSNLKINLFLKKNKIEVWIWKLSHQKDEIALVEKSVTQCQVSRKS